MVGQMRNERVNCVITIAGSPPINQRATKQRRMNPALPQAPFMGRRRVARRFIAVRGLIAVPFGRGAGGEGFAAEISGLTRLYVLWRWNYGEALVPFDEARKLGQSCGVDVSQAWGKGFVRKEKEFVRLLGPQNRKLDDLDDPRDLIDVLHKALLLWEKNRRAEMVQALAEKGHGKSEAFYRVAQAISETLPNESKEKKLLDDFLAGRERVQDEVEKVMTQGRLF